MKKELLFAAGAFSAMEPATYAAHRWVMHGAGWVLHKSHHRKPCPPRRWADRFERNDWFPVIFASATIAAMATGSRVSAWRAAVPIGAGVTAYGAAYAFVHDVYIHRRLGRLPRVAMLERLRDAHAIHHLYGKEPYGMLFPMVGEELREKAAKALQLGGGLDPLLARPRVTKRQS